jgi:outer membrane protein assembly factor BamB
LSSPAVIDTTVYVGGDEANVYALDADDGSELWRVEPEGNSFAFESAPVVVDGTVYVGDEQNLVYALSE